jgi:hypothetical protein
MGGTGCLTTSSTRIDARRRAAGFSLTELIIGSSVSMIVMAGILSAFLLLGRSGMNAANYSMAEAEIRRAIEEFSQDARMASNLTWNSASSITLTLVPPNAYSALPSPHTNQVTYAHDNANRVFYRLLGTPAAPPPPPPPPFLTARTDLVRSVSALTYYRFKRDDTPITDASSNHDAETKRIQISMNVRRGGQTLVDTNTTAVMASSILRNKPVN